MPTISHTCPSCFSGIQADAVFCSRCGREVRREGQGSASGNTLDAARVQPSIEGVAAEGLPLDHFLRSHGALPIPQAESILRQVGQALARMHAPPRGQVHGNVRPGTIRVKQGGKATLGETGTPQGDPWDGADMSTGLVLENTEYMSPEACRGLTPTSASDQYALGAVAYAMLAGRPPFVGAFYRVLVAHLSEGFVPLLEVRPDCPPRLASAVERMLCKDPADRWPDVAEALQAALSGLPGPLPELDTAPWEAPVLSDSPGRTLARAPDPDPRPAESNACREQGVKPVRGRRPGGDAVLGPLSAGPDLGPPPARPIELDEEDVDEEEDRGKNDRRSLFFEPTSPPPAQDWAEEALAEPLQQPMEEPVDEEAEDEDREDEDAVDEQAAEEVRQEVGQQVGMSLVPAAPAHSSAPPGGMALPTPARSIPPRIPPRRRRGRTAVLLLLVLAGGAGWGVWERFGTPGGIADRPGVEGMASGRFADALLEPDDRGNMLLPAPESGAGSRSARAGSTPSLDPSPPGEAADPPSSLGVGPAPLARDTSVAPAPDPETRATPAAPSPAQPAPPPATRPPPQEPAPVALGSLEMNIRPWADVLVNGVSRGRFQTRIALELPAGTHFVRMSNPNFPPFDTTVVVQGGETTVLNKVLQPDTEP